MVKTAKIFLFLYLVKCLINVCDSQSTTRVTVVHTSDVHLHFAESGALHGGCEQKTNCHGGLARFVKFVEELKEARSNLLVVDAGGFIPGRLLQVDGGREAVTELVKPLPFDAMAFGAFELSDGIDALADYVKIVGQKFVCTNLEFSKSSENGRYLAKMCHKTMIKMYGELQIGIISYINKESLSKSIKGITILDEVEALNAGISELESMSEDISIILALGYSHHALDKRILEKVPKINLIISGNSFAMFYNGTPPSGAHKDFDYPLTIHHSESGNGSRPVTNQMVVGNYFHMLYAGKLKLVTTNQEVSLDTQSESNPVYMHGEKDPDTQKLVEKHAHALSLILGQSIGFNSFLLDGSHRCRHSECSMGSLVADAMVEAALQSVDAPPPGAWTVAAVALLDSHRVSSSLERGAVYRIDMRNALRNDSSLDVLRLTGAELRGLLENSTRRVLNGSTGFLQVSGVQVVSRPAEDDGPPQLNISVVCAECLLARYEPLNDSTVYSAVVTASFAARLTAPGGPLTASVANRSRQLHGSLRHAAADYISKLSPVFIPTGDRLMLHLQTGTAAPATGAPPDGWRLAAAVAAALLVTRVAGVA